MLTEARKAYLRKYYKKHRAQRRKVFQRWYLNGGKERVIAKVQIAVQHCKDYRLRYLNEHPCVDCGEADPVVLDLDHINDDKEKSVAKFVGSGQFSKMVAEIGKCEVRCSNCHRRRHAYLRA